MPKKTKEQKILAQYRKKLRLLQPSPSISNPEQNNIHSNKTKAVLIESKVFPATQEENFMRRFFFTDLKKSLILIIIVIGLEILFYFVSIKGYLGI
jgi:hypothetical protein